MRLLHKTILAIAIQITIYQLLITACAAPTPLPTPRNFAPFILVTSDPNSSATPTPFQPAGQTSAPVLDVSPTASTTLTTVPSLTPIPTSTATLPPPPQPVPVTFTLPPPQPVPPTSMRTNYVMYATLDFKAHTLAVDESIYYVNTTRTALSDIVFSIQPNRYSGAFVLNSISQDNTALTSYSISGQRLTLNLPQPLQPNAATTLQLNFYLYIPAKASNGLFGYDFNQVNLVDWYPFIVPYSNGWILHDSMSFGEHLVYDSSDIELNLKTDSDVVVAAPAPAESNGDYIRYRLYGARTFALSASNEFLMADSASGSVTIHSYYFSGYKAAADSILYSAGQAVSLFSVKFAPYPYQHLSIVQADIHDGQEYDGLVFLATDFYGQYGGGSKNNLTTIGVHEIAHEWWFGLIGNDQAMEPWLDEALSVYSERIFYEYNYPRYGDWWWQFRVDYFGGKGYVDTTIYNGGTFRTYTNAVYLNGAHFMEDLRGYMGDDDFYDFLQDYAARFSRSRATSYDFFAVARQHTSADLSSLVAKYFSGTY